jgi:hypothetical protein
MTMPLELVAVPLTDLVGLHLVRPLVDCDDHVILQIDDRVISFARQHESRCHCYSGRYSDSCPQHGLPPRVPARCFAYDVTGYGLPLPTMDTAPVVAELRSTCSHLTLRKRMQPGHSTRWSPSPYYASTR